MHRFVPAVCGLILTASAATAETATFQTCRASWENGRLTIANRHVAREWVWKDGKFVATSFRDLDANLEWLAKSGIAPSSTSDLKFSAHEDTASSVQAPSLKVQFDSPRQPAIT